MLNTSVAPNLQKQDETGLLASFRGLSGRVGIFGGTFDPLHNGHLATAEAARRAFNLDTVVFVPTSHNPLKSQATMASGEERVEMIRRSICDRIGFLVSPIEALATGPSYTVDLLKAVHAENLGSAEFYFIAADDAIASMPAWNDFHTIFQLAKIIPVRRIGGIIDHLEALPDGFTRREIVLMQSNYVDLPALEISSTKLRELLKRGESGSEFMPKAVCEFISERRLYK